MSTIVVVKKQGKVCIAADTLTTFGDVRQSASYDSVHDKILKYHDNFIGIVGSAAHQIVLESLLATHKDLDFSSRTGIFETFRRLHPVLKEEYYLNPKDEEEDPYESSRIDALVANPSGIFGVYALREVFEYNSFWAVGSGSELALGAMHAVYPLFNHAEEIAKAGVDAGAEFNVATGLPMTSYCSDLTRPPQTIQV